MFCNLNTKVQIRYARGLLLFFSIIELFPLLVRFSPLKHILNFVKNRLQLYPLTTTQGDRFASCENIVPPPPWFRHFNRMRYFVGQNNLHHSPAPPLQSKFGRFFFLAGSSSSSRKLLGGDSGTTPQEDCRRLYIFNVCSMKDYYSGL